jgi:hypothetical protein
MFGASASYLFCLVPQLVDASKIDGPSVNARMSVDTVAGLNTFIGKAFRDRRSRVQSVVSVRL